MVVGMGAEVAVTAVEVVMGSEGLCYSTLEMAAAMTLTKVGMKGGGC